MKKLFLVLAAAMLTVSASAQKTTITSNKAGDNWYVGLNAGVATPVSKFNVGTECRYRGMGSPERLCSQIGCSRW